MDHVDQETRIQQAIQALSSGAITSERLAARTFSVPRSTLRGRKGGKETRSHAHISLQRLSADEEDALVRACSQLNAWGWPLRSNTLENLAFKFLKDKGDTRKLGANWYKNFIARNPEITLKRARAISDYRRDDSNFQIVTEWFDLFKITVSKYDIAEGDIYNMDNKGIMKQVKDNTKVIVSREDPQVSNKQPGDDNEWASIIECIGINGYSLPPYIIFEGEHILHEWADERIDRMTCVAISPTGWANAELNLTWLKHFDTYTKPQLRGRYRLLVLDGNSIPISYEFLAYCMQNDIIALCLPPNGTRVLQPLDVGVFGPLAEAYEMTSRLGPRNGDNVQFMLCYQEARNTISSNIPGAWRDAGLSPFNPARILTQYRPKTTPYASFTNENGVRIDVEVGSDLGERINQIVAEVLDVCLSPCPCGYIPLM